MNYPKFELPIIKPVLPEISTNKKYGFGKEAQLVREEIGNFDISSCQAMKLLKIQFGDSLRTSEIKGIINAVSIYLESKNIYLPKLSRNAKRSFVLLVKYINDYIEVFQLVLPYVSLCDSEGKDILIDKN